MDVTVITPGGTSPETKKGRFKYGKPVVSSISPSFGSTAGGTEVTIGGGGFAIGAGNTALLFGKTPAGSVNCSSTTSCVVIVPASSKTGLVDVRAVVEKAKSPKAPPGDRYAYE